MLKRSSKHFVFGTSVLLLGCEHVSKSSDSWNERESEIYSRLEEFSPEVFLIELEDFYELDWAKHKTDIRAILSYISDSPLNRADHTYKYDLDKAEYDHEARRPSKSTEDTVEYRKASRKNTPRHFTHILQIREENASMELMEFLGDYNQVVMHCGSTHYPVYKEYLEFLGSLDR